MGARVQGIAVGGPKHRTATGGQDGVLPVAQFLDDVLFEIAERYLAVMREPFADRHADASFNLCIAVDEYHAETACQLAPDRGLATAGHAN